jgi:hypothetical protein
LVGRVFDEVVRAGVALNVEGLRHSRIVEQLILDERLPYQLYLVPVKAVFAKGTLAPAAAIKHSASVGGLLLAVIALVLRTNELPCLRFGFELSVETGIMV